MDRTSETQISAPAAAEQHAAMLARLRSIRRAKQGLELQDIDYWGDRFTEQNIRFWVGCTFTSYLKDPEYWERMAQNARGVVARTGSHRLFLMRRADMVRLIIHLS